MNVKLYGKTTSGVKTWRVSVSHFGGVAKIIVTTATKINGKEVSHETVISNGKNIGKANETSAYGQAILEAESKVRKQKDKGYLENLDEILNQVVDAKSSSKLNSMGLPQPMAAKVLDVDKFQTEERMWIQPKLDGHRMIAKKVGDVVTLYSRGGKLITTMVHIENEILEKIPGDVILDGELYLHGDTLQNITSLIKKQQPTSINVRYNVYDIISEESFHIRGKNLANIYYKTDFKFLDLVETNSVSSIEQAMIHFRKFRTRGYEGAMLRVDGLPYRGGYRCGQLLKIKQRDDAEYTVVDVVEGKPKKDKQGVIHHVAVLVCDCGDTTFNVTAPGNMKEKDGIWIDRSSYIGKIVTVAYANLTVDGIPFHPVCLRFREDV